MLDGQRQPENLPNLWFEVDTHAKRFIEHEDDRDVADRDRAIHGSWYCPCVQLDEAMTVHWLCQKHDIETVIDLGAGDLRFALFMGRLGYDVIAYEVLDDLLDHVLSRFDLGDIDLRRRDYYQDFLDLVDRYDDAAFVAFGGTNKLPLIPDTGIAVQGYSETGVSVWIDGDKLAFDLAGLQHGIAAVHEPMAETKEGGQ